MGAAPRVVLIQARGRAGQEAGCPREPLTYVARKKGSHHVAYCARLSKGKEMGPVCGSPEGGGDKEGC